MERVILKLSGQALSNGDGILSSEKLLFVGKQIKALYDAGYEIGIVNGAGNIWRGRDSEENHMDRVIADEIGMLGTVINSFAISNTLNELNVPNKVLSAVPVPTFTNTYTVEDAIKAFDDKQVVIFAGGTGKPYCSTDSCASLRAKELNIKYILMAKNGTDGVYDSDPRKNPLAKKYDHLTYQELIDQKLEVMDLGAAKVFMEENVTCIVFDMNVEGNIVKVLNDYSIGTVVANK